MNPPISLDQLNEMWSIDAGIDQTEPGKELARIPSLHSKYLRILSHHNLVVNKLTQDYNKMKKIKTEYYGGDLNNPDDLKLYGWEPMIKKIIRPDIPLYLDADQDLITLLIKRVMNQEIVNTTTSILRELNSRTYQLRSFIDYLKFTNGGN
jgi:hypothetical protein